MTEKDMQVLFGKYLKNKPPETSEVYELKITKEKRLAFNKVQDHQVEALQKAENEFIYHKLTDPPVFGGMATRFNAKRPFDCMVLTKIKSFVVVLFYKPRQTKVAIKIPIGKFVEMRNNNPKKSFTEQEALQNGSIIIL